MFREVQARIEQRLEDDDRPPRRVRGLSPDMFEHLLSQGPRTPVALLAVAGLIRDELPWLSEVTLEAYRVVSSGSQRDLQRFGKTLARLEDEIIPLMTRTVSNGKAAYMVRFVPPMLRDAVGSALELKKTGSG